jgi:AcrR family transcriptional regulator
VAGKREALRQELTEKILSSAISRVEKYGLNELRARDITKDAGCALGTLYKCYADLDDLIIHINSSTLKQLREVMEEAAGTEPNPTKRLKNLAFAYLDFALAHQQRWEALFGHKLPNNMPTPEWHRQENIALLAHIANALRELDPTLSKAKLKARARTYFAAVHGIVEISLQERFVSVSGKTLRSELNNLVDRLA